jgi:hypothetical protein
MINVKTATTAELVAFYNANAFQPVKKFADRKTAERRVQALLDAAETVDNSVLAMVGLPPVEKKASFAAKQPKASTTRSAGIAASWTVKAFADKRKERTGTIEVRQGNKLIGTYRSVAHAFTSLGMSLKGHIPFRMMLKVEGQLTYDCYSFAIAK